MSEKTQHGINAKYGIRTRHKYPESSIQTEDNVLVTELSNLVNELYPTGRAFYKPKGGTFDLLHDAINLSFLRFVKKYRNLIDASIPDNENFTADDASFLEFKYGLIDGTGNDLELRKSALRRKMGHPNNIKGRQSKNFIENQLRISGFNVRVFENTPTFASVGIGSVTSNIPIYKTPGEVSGSVVDTTQHGGDTQHGEGTFHGGVTFEVVANKIDPDESYGVGDNLWASFFICGENLGENAIIPESRRREFRELVLKLKPAHLAAYIFVNFT
jgi:hypothetical protein